MKIKKILLYNFKNFRNETVIDFSNGITFLVGPNGFGKTTIFDAIELGLTGSLSRVSSKDKITPENIKYNKPFFQNDSNQPVIIKLWLEKENEEAIIVRKFESASESSKQMFAPLQSINQFKLFNQIKKDDLNFSNIENLDALPEISQNSIDEFLEVEGKYEIEKIFNIFNYIQQEETTFFLKQNEQKRSDSLSFLVKTDEIEDKIKKIKKVTKAVNETIKKIRKEQADLTRQETGDVPYQRLFNHKEFPFDQVTPFSIANLNQLEHYKIIIQDIVAFKQNFSISEYQRKLKRDNEKRLINNDLVIKDALYFSILCPIIKSTKFWGWEAYTLMNSVLFEYVLLEKYILEYKQVVSDFKRRNQLNIYLENLSGDITIITERSFSYDKDDSLAKYFVRFQNSLLRYQTLRNNASQVDKNLSDLQQLRRDLSNKLGQHQHIDKTKCPFCNSAFQSFEALEQSGDNYRDYLNKISSQNIQQLQEAQSSVNNIITQIKQKIIEELNRLKFDVDETLMKKISELHNNLLPTDLENIENFKDFIQSYTNIIPCPIRKLSFNEYHRQYELNKQEFRSKLLVNDEIYSLLDIKNLKNIEQRFEELKKEYSEFNFTSFYLKPILNQKISKSTVDSHLEKLREQLQLEIDRNYLINENLITDRQGVFLKYFDNDINRLEKISVQDLEQKKYYLEKQSNLVKNRQFTALSKKIETLMKTDKQLEEISRIYEEEVKEFKINIIKQLRIPFFIYSAKMLQNYQQGFGIFLTYKEATENTDEKAVIRFKSDPSNDHDAVHQLSTGQLAVVSLAFTLSLNTMFKLSEHLNFLMIDDPIQDMDAMNVLSFIEILRHGIIDKYQIILSTYSDSNALFMGYKFTNSNLQVDIKYVNVRGL